MDDQQKIDTLWNIGARVVAGLATLAAVTVAIRGIVSIATKSLQDHVRAAFKKELE